LVDDVSGEPADETVSFSFDGADYEIELTAKNAKKLRAELGVWAASARVTRSKERRRHRSPAGNPGPRAAIERDESEAIRAWGKLNGYPVSVRGPIAFHLVDMYRADQAAQAASVAAVSPLTNG
jgi:hypothetical protein